MALRPAPALVLLVASLTLAACGGSPVLRAEGPERLDDAHDAAIAVHDDGLRMAVIAGSWTFRPRSVARTTLPLEMIIENRSEYAWHIRYDDIRLVDDRGVEHAPLRPGQVPVRASDAGTLHFVSLPEETVRTAERVSGFVFFAPLPAGTRAVALRWLPRRAFGQDRLDTLEVTFSVHP